MSEKIISVLRCLYDLYEQVSVYATATRNLGVYADQLALGAVHAPSMRRIGTTSAKTSASCEK